MFPRKPIGPRSGPGWTHEIKHDGYRLIARRDGVGVRLMTRNSHDFSERYLCVLITSSVLISHQNRLPSRNDRPACFVLRLRFLPFKPKLRLEAENAALRLQLSILQWKLRSRVPLTVGNQLFFLQL
jgi:hypothetical protein